MVEMFLNAFQTAGIDKEVVEELWEYNFDLNNKTCKRQNRAHPAKKTGDSCRATFWQNIRANDSMMHRLEQDLGGWAKPDLV